MPVASPLRALAAAVSLLTRMPLARRFQPAPDHLAAGAVCFPLVGAAVGALVGLVAWLLYPALPATVAAAVAVGAGLVLTGALHLDGLADTADALGGRSREHALTIMRDHSIGTYGAAALLVDLLVKTSAIAALAERGDAVAALAVAGAVSRSCAAPLARALPSARPGGGLGHTFAGSVTTRAAAAGALLGVALAYVLLGTDGLVMAASAGALTVAFGFALRRWLGGMTGDTLGAAVELAETLALVVAVALGPA